MTEPGIALAADAPPAPASASRRARRRIALAWAAAAFALLALLAQRPGISPDEAAILAAAEVAGPGPGGAVPPEDAFAGPRLAPAVSAAAHAVGTRAGLSHLRSARLGTALAGAALAALLALLAFELAGPAAALLAPALYLAAPRALHLGTVATADTALAALWVALAWSSLRAARAGADPSARRARGAALLTGVLFGLALAARLDAWILIPALAVNAIGLRLLGRRAAARSPGDGLEARLGEFPLALAACLVLGPLVLAATWPELLRDPGRLGLALRGAAGPLAPPALLAGALALPAVLLLACGGGLVHAGARVVRAARGRLGLAALREDLLLALLAVAPLAAAALGLAPGGGIRPVIASLAILALLGARAIVSAASVAWPARALPLTAALALLVVYPGVRAAVSAWPTPGSAFGELVGGISGAAARGLPRQDGGEAVASVLAEVSARARPGARVYWPGVPAVATTLYQRDGRLGADLARADRPEDADLAVVPLDGGSRDVEYQVWAAFRTARPVAGGFLHEVPLVLVYARPGAWQ